jgi:hypothetical protein
VAEKRVGEILPEPYFLKQRDQGLIFRGVTEMKIPHRETVVVERPSPQQLHDEIKKYSRQFLIRMFAGITPLKIELFRDVLDNFADFLDNQSTDMRNSSAKNLGRPSGDLVCGFSGSLTQGFSDH